MISLLLSSFLTFVHLNCENLFDCRHDSLKQDTEFLPDAPRRWTVNRYWNKLNNISKEIIACGETREGDWNLPDMVSLCEVENDSVLVDLTRRSLLKRAGYEYIMTSSPDLRGIDVALLYSPYSFSPLRYYPLRVQPLKDQRPTRDILYVSGLTSDMDTLHVFVVHAPSRSGGERKTRSYRLAVAQRLCMSVDSIRGISPDARIIISGDFNDYDRNASVRHIVQASLSDISSGVMGTHGARGTYKYKGEWASLDHVFVSTSMQSLLQSCYIFDAPFLLEDDERYGGKTPFRCYKGFSYRNAYSDHLPLVARFGLP